MITLAEIVDVRAVSAVLKIMVDRQAGLRKRTRGDEDDRQAAAQA
jgi:hypothetical protein